MKYLISLFLISSFAHASGVSYGLPLPGIPKSLGPKTMAQSTSVTIATDQQPVGITFSSTTSLTVSQGPPTSSASSGWIITGSAYTQGKAAFTPYRNVYTTITPVTTVAYTQILAAISQSATEIEIFDSSGQTLVLAFGASGSEVNKCQILPGGNGRIPLAIPQGTRLSVKAVSANATGGELDINFYDH